MVYLHLRIYDRKYYKRKGTLFACSFLIYLAELLAACRRCLVQWGGANRSRKARLTANARGRLSFYLNMSVFLLFQTKAFIFSITGPF